MSDYSWIPAVAGAVAKGANSYATSDKANAEMQEAYRQMLDNLQARFSDYDALGKAGYQDIAAQEVGPSALGNIQNDPQARAAEQEALAKLSELAANGGLSLADLKALNDIQGVQNQNNVARRKGLANEFAARGQLGAGAQLAMDLDAQQNAAMNANEAGESVAAQAQARAMQAILEKGRLARGMADADYRTKAEAARAADMIAARNAAARTDAAKTNNAYRGQTYADELAKAKGKTSLTNSMNEAVFGSGRQNAATTQAQGGYRNDLIDSGSAAWDKFSGDGRTEVNDYAQRGSPSDLTDNEDDK